MLIVDDLITLGMEDQDKAKQAIELLGDVAKKLTSDEIVEKRVGKAWNEVDSTLREITGTDKKENEKTTEYIKRVIPEIREKLKSETQIEINELREQLKGAGTEETKKLREKIKELEDHKASIPKIIEERENEWKSKYTELEKNHTEFQKKAALVQHMPTTFRQDIPERLLKIEQDRVMAEALTEYDQIEVKDGKTYLVNSTTYTRAVASDYLREKLKDVIADPGAAGGGASSGGARSDVFAIPDEYKTTGEKLNYISEYIKNTLGISVLSSEYPKKYNELREQAGLLKK
jgi:hypothetical protein